MNKPDDDLPYVRRGKSIDQKRDLIIAELTRTINRLTWGISVMNTKATLIIAFTGSLLAFMITFLENYKHGALALIILSPFAPFTIFFSIKVIGVRKFEYFNLKSKVILSIGQRSFPRAFLILAHQKTLDELSKHDQELSRYLKNALVFFTYTLIISALIIALYLLCYN